MCILKRSTSQRGRVSIFDTLQILRQTTEEWTGNVVPIRLVKHLSKDHETSCEFERMIVLIAWGLAYL